MRKLYVDTSVFVAATWTQHPDHAAASHLVDVTGRQAILGINLHGIAEIYAALSTLPVTPRFTAASVGLVVASLFERATVLTMDGSDYLACCQDLASRGHTGGVIYDRLHVRELLKTGVPTKSTP